MIEIKFRKQPQIHYPFKNVSLRKAHIGKILISESVLLDWLQFPKGKIRGMYLDEGFGNYGQIIIVLEDKEMPEVREGEPLPIITPIYKIKLNKKGRIIKLIREKIRK